MKYRLNSPVRVLLWFLEGMIVGFGAIMPGLSGGTLCVAFGMYLPLIRLISHPRENIKACGVMLGMFALGAAVGFVALSGLAAHLMERDSLSVICAFVGFILGTFPELWADAGKEGRSKGMYIGIPIGFCVMLGLLTLIQSQTHLQLRADFFGFLISGVLWGLSFIVPGLSSSTLLLFFGLYQPMLDGIAGLELGVILPLVCGMGACVLVLSKVIHRAYQKYYGVISHVILGVVAATTVMILPDWRAVGFSQIFCMLGGAVLSYVCTQICAKLQNRPKDESSKIDGRE